MAVQSAVSICNVALRLLGAKPITALTDNTTEGRAANESYDSTRKALLRSHPWNFAMARTNLDSPLVAAPAWGYAVQFELPANVLIVRALNKDTLNWASWKVESRRLLCDMTTAGILYTTDFEDAAAMPADFGKALSGALALEFAHQLTGLTKGIKLAQAYYDLWLSTAKTNDGMEGTSEPLEDTTLVDERNQ